MPSEPRAAEPTVEELSAYLDHELDAAAHTRVAEHVATCAACQQRLDGLRQAAHAVRGLPMETPSRSFTIPAAQPRRAFRWAPVGWIGGAAAALLLIAVGLQQIHFPAATGGGASTAMYAPARNSSQASGPEALSRSNDQSAGAALKAAAPAANTGIVIDPRNPQRRLTVSTDRASYAANEAMIVRGYLEGAAGAGPNRVQIFLRRGAYAVELKQPSLSTFATSAYSFQGNYSLADLSLPTPTSGSYVLLVTWTVADGSTLIAELPVTITG